VSCTHPKLRLIMDHHHKDTWQWCRDCGAFRERPSAIWNEPSDMKTLRSILRDFLGIRDAED
jgi:hypothetical protein